MYVRKSVDQMFTNWIEVMRAQPTSSKQQTKDDENTQTKPKVAELFMKLSVIFDSEYIYTFFFLSVLSDCRVGLEFNSNFGSCFVPDAVL